jgi:hypothetical protein
MKAGPNMDISISAEHACGAPDRPIPLPHREEQP